MPALGCTISHGARESPRTERDTSTQGKSYEHAQEEIAPNCTWAQKSTKRIKGGVSTALAALVSPLNVSLPTASVKHCFLVSCLSLAVSSQHTFRTLLFPLTSSLNAKLVHTLSPSRLLTLHFMMDLTYIQGFHPHYLKHRTLSCNLNPHPILPLIMSAFRYTGFPTEQVQDWMPPNPVPIKLAPPLYFLSPRMAPPSL